MAARFESRVALISGAGSGIGRAVAERFLREGGRVALIGRTHEKLRAVADPAPPESCHILVGRHEDPEFARRAAVETAEVFGRIDLLFNNAGAWGAASVADTSDDLWSTTLASNVTGPFLLTREVLPVMRRQRGGVIVNNASTLGLSPIPGAAPYCAAKAALIMLTRSTAIEEAASGIRVNAICPGVVDTPIHAQRIGPDRAALDAFMEEAGRQHPLGRVGTPEEVAALVLFLASDESSWTTGAIVTVDGGISLR